MAYAKGYYKFPVQTCTSKLQVVNARRQTVIGTLFPLRGRGVAAGAGALMVTGTVCLMWLAAFMFPSRRAYVIETGRQAVALLRQLGTEARNTSLDGGVVQPRRTIAGGKRQPPSRRLGKGI